ncbi:MAG: hypothetical protein AAFY56_21650, partial [Pseudomonadota bacterium]
DEDAVAVASEGSTATPALVTETGLTAIPKRRPQRFGDIDWTVILGKNHRAAETVLSAQADCAVESLAVPLANITTRTTVGESFWLPVSGKLDDNATEYDTGSGLQVLACEFASVARANLLFHQNDDAVFRIDILFERNRCYDLSDRTCLRETIAERANDIDLYLSAGSPGTYSTFGSVEVEDQAYAARYRDFLDDADDNRRLSWSNCARVPTPIVAAMEDAGLSHRCIVEAQSQEDTWSSISFLEITGWETGDFGNPSMLASKMTFAREPSERAALDRHMAYFQTIVGNSIANADSQPSQDEAAQNDVVFIKEVSALDGVIAKPPIATAPTVSSEIQRERMKVILERLIGLSP